tara:strand:+ start:724 stop:1248 length:525 start_codon:yes stop_codon:yes gene_type:complete
MKKKTVKLNKFIEGLHKSIISSPQFRKNISGKSEVQIQTEIRPLIIQYLEYWFREAGYKDYVGKANKSFYWEGQEGKYGGDRAATFGARNYPDFIITEPYLIAVEYKQSLNGSTVKQGIGQSLMHTMTEDFHYVYYLFHDENKDKRIVKSTSKDKERHILNKLCSDFNLFIKIV